MDGQWSVNMENGWTLFFCPKCCFGMPDFDERKHCRWCVKKSFSFFWLSGLFLATLSAFFAFVFVGIFSSFVSIAFSFYRAKNGSYSIRQLHE